MWRCRHIVGMVYFVCCGVAFVQNYCCIALSGQFVGGEKIQ